MQSKVNNVWKYSAIAEAILGIIEIVIGIITLVSGNTGKTIAKAFMGTDTDVLMNMVGMQRLAGSAEDKLKMLLIFMGVGMIIGGLINFIFYRVAMKGKAVAGIVLGFILIIGAVCSFFQGGINFSIYNIICFIVAVAYLVGAFMQKKINDAED